jgi:hypothetical protein
LFVLFTVLSELGLASLSSTVKGHGYVRKLAAAFITCTTC